MSQSKQFDASQIQFDMNDVGSRRLREAGRAGAAAFQEELARQTEEEAWELERESKRQHRRNSLAPRITVSTFNKNMRDAFTTMGRVAYERAQYAKDVCTQVPLSGPILAAQKKAEQANALAVKNALELWEIENLTSMGFDPVKMPEQVHLARVNHLYVSAEAKNISMAWLKDNGYKLESVTKIEGK